MKEFRPMLAATVEDVSKLRFPLLGSYKIDGIRCLITQFGPLTRTLKRIPNLHLQRELEKLPVGLDGELIVPDTTFRGTTSAIMRQSGEPKFQYLVFDDFTAPEKRFVDRYVLAEEKVEGTSGTLLDQFLLEDVDSCLELYKESMDKGLEGLILRDPNAPYKYGRSTLNQQWMMKLKPWKDDYATVVGITEEEENRNEVVVNVLGLSKRSSHQENKRGKNRMGALLVHSTMGDFSIGTGFTEQDRIALWKSPPIGRRLKFKYLTVGAYTVPRHPVFLGWSRYLEFDMSIVNNPDCDDEGYLRGLLQELLELEGGLTDWEVDFVDSVDTQGFTITPKQAAVIERIYNRLIGL